RQEHQERMFNDLWRTVPQATPKPPDEAAKDEERRRSLLQLPQENVLYFLEKTAPNLQNWQREILRIVRMVSQYFYPQKQTKVMNEGCATAVHYHIMTRLHETGRLTDGAFMEFLHHHTNVVFQPGYDDPRFSGINPYALGFHILQDLKRIALDPTEEDRRWFPDIAGSGDFLSVWKHAWAEYRDESFILQFLGPKVMRDLRLFALRDDAREPHLTVDAIHDDAGYREVRRALSAQYDLARHEPDIQVVDVDLAGDRRLILEHRTQDGRLLAERDAHRVLRHLALLWGYPVRLFEVDARNETVFNEYADVEPPED
ncbi:MAG: SpoVR family protein, partial [Ectothiorhodospira sp.]